MHKFLEIPYPPIETVLKEIDKYPKDIDRIGLGYILTCQMIRKTNQLREEADIKRVPNRRDYDFKDWASYTQKTRVGNVKVYYPRLQRLSVHKQVEVVEEALLEELKEEIARIYISGDSDRDIAHDLKASGIDISPSTVSRYYREVKNSELSAFISKDLLERSFLCVQVDTMYMKARVPALPHPLYKTEGLARVLGLATDTRCFECLALIPIPNESIIGYEIVFDILLDKDIGEVFLLGSDFHSSFASAIMSSFIGSQRQGCRYHYQSIVVKASSNEEDYILGLETIRGIHDQDTKEEAEAEYNRRRKTLKERSPDVFQKVRSHVDQTLAYKEYPQVFAKKISTTNQDERSNEETRRRYEPIHASPSIPSNLLMAFSVTQREEEEWRTDPKGTVEEMQEAIQTHDKLLDQVYSSARDYLKFFPDYQTDPIDADEFVALWVHLYILPVKTEKFTMSVGFLTIRGVRKDKTTILISLQAIRENSISDYRQCAKSLVERGLDPEKIRLIIMNRPNHKISSAFKRVFKKSSLYMDPAAFKERLIYLLWDDDNLQEIIANDFDAIYASQDLPQAKIQLKKLESDLEKYKLSIVWDYFRQFDGDTLVNAFKLVDEKIWSEVGIEDFAQLSRWENFGSTCRNNPKNLIETVKGLKKTHKRKSPAPNKAS